MELQISGKRALISLLVLAAGLNLTASAATIYWDGVGTGYWTNVTQWSTVSDATTPDPILIPTNTDIAVFSISTATGNQIVNLNAAQNVSGLRFLGINGGGSVTIQNSVGAGNRGINIGADGIVMDSGAGAVVIGSAASNRKVPITLTAAQAWSNNSSNTLTTVGTQNGNLVNGGFLLTVDGIGNTTISNIITGTGGLTKNGTGTLVLGGTNTYSGNTVINGGVLSIASTGSLPGVTVAGRYTVASNAALAVGTAVTDSDVSAILGTGNFAAGAIFGYDTSAGSRTNSNIISNTAAGTLGLLKLGANTLTLSGANTFTGGLTVKAGTVNAGHPFAFGQSSVTVSNGAQITSFIEATYTNALTLTGIGDQGALRFDNNAPAMWAGPITLAGGARIGAYSSSGSYTLSGGISGTGDLEIWAGGASSAHTHIFTIAAPCTYTGDTLLNTYAAYPIVVLAGGANTLPTNSTLNMLAGVWNGQVLSAALKLNGNNQILAGLVSGSGVFGSGGSNRVVNGSVTPATLTINCTKNMFFDGMLGGAGANENNLSLVKTGSGKQTIQDMCTHSGTTAVNAGTLSLPGTLNGGAVTVADGAMLLLGNGTNTMTGLTLSTNSTLGVNVGSPSNPSNTVIQVNGDLMLDGTLIVLDLGDAAASNVITSINYTGTLTDLGMTTDPRSPWSVQVDTSVTGKVNLILQSKLPEIAFTTDSTTVSNSLQLDMHGVIRGFPATPVYYEVHTPDGRLWDFGAMPPVTNWTVHLRHLRPGTNNVRVFVLNGGNVLKEDFRQVVLQLGTNSPVRPRPYPAEIWWGGVATALAPEYGYEQLTDPALSWDFVKQYEDGIFFHGILPSPETLEKMAAAVAPHMGRFGREGGYYSQPDPGYGFNDATVYSADQQSLAGRGVYLSFHSLDFNPGMETWAAANPGWCQKWPDWTHEQLINSNMQCWVDFVGSMQSKWPGLKLGWTWSPVWFNWNGYPALGTNDLLILHPVTDASGNPVTNSSGTNAWFDFDMQEFFSRADAVAQAGDGYFGFATDCPYDYFAQWKNYSDQTNNQAKILGYEAWERTNGYFATTICNYSLYNKVDTWDDARYLQKSFAYIIAKQQLGGRTQKYLFEAWYKGPFTWAPESNTNSFSGMVKDAIKYLKGIADTNGALEQLKLTLQTGGLTNVVVLRNDGDVTCLPAVAGFETGAGSNAVTYYDAVGSNVTALVLSAEGYVYTNLLAPGQTTTISVVSSAPLDRTVTLEAFWNPQDPTGVVRDRLTLSPPPNQPPVLAAISNYTIIAGQTLVITNVATDSDMPPQTLTFSLAGSPAGAVINTNSGVFSWRPAIAQSASTNAVSIVVTDNGTPNLSATQGFWIAVNRPAQPVIGTIGLSNGAVRMTITGDGGPDYSILASTNLINWSSIWVTNPLAPPFIFSDPSATNLSRRFYRILLGP